jgi:branched-chain amino acid transport system permease protein
VFAPGEHYVNLATRILVLSLFAVSFNLLFGTTGLLSFGQALFYGLGAYMTGMLTKEFGADQFIVFLLLGGIAAVIVSIILGMLCLRLTGVYFTMLSLAFAQLGWGVCIKWYSFTGGDDGIQGIAKPPLFSDPFLYYGFCLAVVTICLLILWQITRSSFGKVLRGIRQNPVRVTFLGLNVYWHQNLAYVISAFFSAIAGGLYAGIDGSIHPNMFFWTQSGAVILMAILGGIGSFFGPLIGAAVFTLLEDSVIRHTEYWSFIIGAIMLTVVLVLPKGLIGILGIVQRITGRSVAEVERDADS